MSHYYFIFHQEHILFCKQQDQFVLPDALQVQNVISPLDFIFPVISYHDDAYFVAALQDDINLPSMFELVSLRKAFEILSPRQLQFASKARQLLEWQRDHQFCGRCGGQTEFADHDRAKRCPRCELLNYPRIAPCMMVIISRGADEILLARSAHFKTGVFSVLAGFVEPGEAVEETVHREVFEEVGLQVQNVRYVASQSWPFPNMLMLGFSADYLAGEIKIDKNEIEEAYWFKRGELPPLPAPFSLAYRLIND